MILFSSILNKMKTKKLLTTQSCRNQRQRNYWSKASCLLWFRSKIFLDIAHLNIFHSLLSRWNQNIFLEFYVCMLSTVLLDTRIGIPLACIVKWIHSSNIWENLVTGAGASVVATEPSQTESHSQVVSVGPHPM